MRRSNTDYLTIAGLVIFIILTMGYIALDYVDKAHPDISIDVPHAGVDLPELSLDGFNALDNATKLLYLFVFTLVTASVVGSFGLYFFYRRVRASK
jgi:hypothetical protein